MPTKATEHRSGSPPPPSITRAEYEDCFRRALRRMAVTLNLRRLGLRRSQLRCDDIKLAGLLGDRSDRELFRLRRVAMPDAKANEPDVAENFFYGSFAALKAPPRPGRWP